MSFLPGVGVLLCSVSVEFVVVLAASGCIVVEFVKSSGVVDSVGGVSFVGGREIITMLGSPN